MKSVLTLFCFFLQLFYLNAQQWAGISESNYAGTNAIYRNPANIANSRQKLYVNLVGAGAWMTNSYFSWNQSFSYWSMFTGNVPAENKTAAGKVIFDKSYFDEADANKRVDLYAVTEVRGPAILYSIDKKNAVAIHTRLRTGTSTENAPAALVNLVYRGINNAPITGQMVDVSNGRVNANSFAELGLSYARVLTEEDSENMFKVGVTLKRMVGVFSGYGVSYSGNYTVVNDNRNPQFKGVLVDNVTGNYGFVNKAKLQNAMPDWLWNNSAPSYGLGMDIGIVYEYRPDIDKYWYNHYGDSGIDPTENTYKFRIGASLMDIGELQFALDKYAVNASTADFTQRDFPPNTTVKDLSNTIISNLSGKLVGVDNSFVTTLPTTVQIQADYLWKKNLYVGATWVQNLTSAQSYGLKVPSSFSLVPRYERKYVEFALPLVLFDDYSKVAFGSSLRLGPLWVGTDNLGSFLNIGKPRGLDVYFALGVPILYKKPKLAQECWYEGKGEHWWNRILKKR